MNSMLKSVAIVLITAAAGVSLPAAAHADIPPPDTCLSEGVACHNAGPQAADDGQCTAATCTKTLPGGAAMHYDCLLCKAPGDAGAGGTAGEAGEAATAGAAGDATEAGGAGAGGKSNAGGATHSAGAAHSAGASNQAGAAGSGTPGSSDDGGCAIGVLGSEKGVASLMLGLGLAALGLSRRRRDR